MEIDFQTNHFPDFKQFGHFDNLEQFTLFSHFSNYRHVTINQPLLLWAGYGCFTEYGQDIRPRKTFQSLSVWQQIQEPYIDLSQVIFDDLISGNQELNYVTRYLICTTNNLENILQIACFVCLFVCLFFDGIYKSHI